MSYVTIVFIIIGIILAWGAVQGAKGQKKWNKIIADQFSKAGLVNSPGEREHIEKLLQNLFNKEEKIISQIEDINKIPFGKKEVYFCNVNIEGIGRSNFIFADLFIFPLRLSMDHPLLIFFKSDCAEGVAYVKDIITKKYVLPDLYIPDKLIQLDLSKQQKFDSILFAYSAIQTSLNNIVSTTLLPKLLQAGKHGFFAIYCGNGKAALLTLERHAYHQIYDIDWDRQWRYVKNLMRS